MKLPSPLTTKWLAIGIIINVSAHMIYGSEPALSRFMQTVQHWPTFLLTFAIHLLALLAYAPRLVQRGTFAVVCQLRRRRQGNKLELGSNSSLVELDNDGESVVTVELEEEEDKKFTAAELEEEEEEEWLYEEDGEAHVVEPLRSENGKRTVMQNAIYRLVALRELLLGNWLLIAYIFLVSFRRITNIYSPKLISAFYVQLITLSNPFMVSVFGMLLIREKITYHTIVAMFFSLIGGVLVIMGNTSVQGDSFSWKIDFTKMGSDLKLSDIYGIGIALISTVAMSLSFILVKSVGSAKEPISDEQLQILSWSKRFFRKYSRTYSAETLFLAQISGCLVISFAGSLIAGEDWTLVLQTEWTGWLALGALGFVFVTGALSNIFMVWILGATNATTTIPLRLISTLVVGGLVLGEWLHNIAQVLGSIIVFVSVSWYLIMLSKIHRQRQENAHRQPKDVGIQCDLASTSSGTEHMTEKDAVYLENTATRVHNLGHTVS